MGTISADIPSQVPSAIGWAGVQFPTAMLSSFVIPLQNYDPMRVWRGVKRDAVVQLTQGISLEFRGATVASMHTPLVAFPTPHFKPLPPGEAVQCPAARKFTHIASPALPALTLTFTDGPSPFTRQLLPVLRELNLHATFFVRGDKSMLYPDLLHLIALEGHDIGIQAMHASTLVGMEDYDLWLEVSHVLAYVLGITGSRPCYVRPPGGVTSPDLEDMLGTHQLSSSYPTHTITATSLILSDLTRVFDAWSERGVPYRPACQHQCRGAVVEFSEERFGSAVVSTVLSELRSGVEQLRSTKGAEFVRITGQSFPDFAER